MKSRDLQSGTFLLILGVLIVVESLRLPIGTPQEPGAGFYPLLTGSAIAFLSALLLSARLLSRRGEKAIDAKSGGFPRLAKLAVTIGGLLAYTFTLNSLGFLLATFLFMILMLKVIEPVRWRTVLTTAFLTAVGSYLLFEVFLQAQMPEGVLRHFL